MSHYTTPMVLQQAAIPIQVGSGCLAGGRTGAWEMRVALEQELGKQHQESLEVALSPCVVLTSASVSSDQCGNYCDHDRQRD